MTPLFRSKNKQKEETEKEIQTKLTEILNQEEVRKKDSYKEGEIYLTENYLLWKKKKSIKSAIIPLKSIQKIKKSTKWNKVGSRYPGLEIFLENKQYFFPFNSDAFLSMVKIEELESWIRVLETGEIDDKPIDDKPIVGKNVFGNILYFGGHKAYPEKKNGKLIITPINLTFQETKGIKLDKSGEFKLDIPIEKIKEISIKKTSEISRFTSIMAGPMWGVSLPVKKTFVLVEYEDQYGMTQTPLFDFPVDFGSKQKGRVIRAVYDQMKLRKKPQEQQKEEDPLKILKLRYVKGEISKEDFEEMKKTLETI